jgi:hypothetical protein
MSCCCASAHRIPLDCHVTMATACIVVSTPRSPSRLCRSPKPQMFDARTSARVRAGLAGLRLEEPESFPRCGFLSSTLTLFNQVHPITRDGSTVNVHESPRQHLHRASTEPSQRYRARRPNNVGSVIAVTAVADVRRPAIADRTRVGNYYRRGDRGHTHCAHAGVSCSGGGVI